jgi:hypothetical protein
MTGRRRIAMFGALLTLAAPAAATAGPPGSWTKVSSPDQLNPSDLASLARTDDGFLHVAWFRRIPSSSTYDLLVNPVSPAGVVGRETQVATGWVSLGGPTLLASGNELSLFFSGPETSTTGDPHDGLDLATSSDGGVSWAVAPNAIAAGDFVSARDASVVAVDRTHYLESWYAGRETVVHAGLDPLTSNQRGYGDGANQNVASNAFTKSGALVAWCTAVQGANGVYVQPVDPQTGAPAGPVSLMPGSTVVRDGVAETFCPAAAKVPLVSMVAYDNGHYLSSGYFVASTDANRQAVRVWRVGSKNAMTLAAGDTTKQYLALANNSNGLGRLWVGWIEGEKLKLRRSNNAATAFGKTVTVGSIPFGRGGVDALDLAGQGDRVDAVVRVTNENNEVALYHTQSYPGLTLSAIGGQSAVFHVTDAGDPVSGARIKVAGHTLTTNTQGRATVRLRPGHFTATVSKAKYVSDSAKLQIRAPRR